MANCKQKLAPTVRSRRLCIATVKIKPVGPSEIKDIKIIREVIAEIRQERTPEEWARIEARSVERREFLREAMAE